MSGGGGRGVQDIVEDLCGLLLFGVHFGVLLSCGVTEKMKKGSNDCA